MSTTTMFQQPGMASGFARYRASFRRWRGERPFWAGLLTLLGGLPIMYFPYAQMQLGDLSIRMATTAGAGSAVIGALLITLGLTMWFQSGVRVFAGVATLVLVLVSLVVSNFGGFVLGYLLGLFGGGMSIAWAPGNPETPDTAAATVRTGAVDGAAVAGPGGDVTAPRAVEAAPGTGSALAGFTAATTLKGKGRDRAE